MVRKFRGEIQALRAIAVLAVVIYHINPEWLPGGFVGVDVFFVISGFLITQGLLRRVALTGRISAADFWANRARRILPAATLTIIVVTLAALVILPPSQFEHIAGQAVASGLYVQNFALAAQSVDYLGSDRADTPFQHFWSLSIEEQFYLFWPLLVVAAWYIAERIRWASPTDEVRHRRRVRVVATVLFFALVGASFALSVWLVEQRSTTAYFVTGSRVWELGVGGLLAVYAGDPERFGLARRITALAGTLAIIATAFLYSASTPFPGLFALVPVAATAAVIACGRTEGVGSPQKVFELWPLQRIGDWSYSMYLWHFPIIVFFIELAGRRPDPLEAVIIVLVSILIAGFSYYLFEQPILRSPTMRSSAWLTLSSAVIAVIAAVGIGGVPRYLVHMEQSRAEAAQAQILEPPELKAAGEFGPGYRSLRTTMYEPSYLGEPLTPNPGSIAADFPRFAGCGDVPAKGSAASIEPCTVGNPQAQKTLVLAGDSHAVQWAPAFVRALADGTPGNEQWKLVIIARENCPLNYTPRQFEQGRPDLVCSRAMADTVEKITAAKPDAVVIANRRTFDFVGGDAAGQRGYARVLAELGDVPVTFLGDSPAPADEVNLADCVAGSRGSYGRCEFRRDAAAGSDELMRRAAQAAGDRVVYVDALDGFCTDAVCPAVIGSRAVYRDSNHVTAAYAQTLAPFVRERVLKRLTAQQSETPRANSADAGRPR